MNTDLTTEQKDYAIFLPALSGFYATFVGKQRREEYVEKSRIPYPSMESINWLNKKEGLFNYHWSLYSAGHAELDINKDAPKELMIRERDRENSWLLGDPMASRLVKVLGKVTGKIQLLKAQKKREQVLAWMDAYMDYGMILDIHGYSVTAGKKQQALAHTPRSCLTQHVPTTITL